jgi:hypothetical protein
MVDCSSERINEKMQFAMQGVMDNPNFAIAIAIAVGTLFVQIAEHDSPYYAISWIIWITLTVAYWVLIVLGFVAHAHHRMNVAIIETYIKDHYLEYKEDMKSATKGNWIMTLAIKRFWLDKPTEKVNNEYNFLTVSFLLIFFFCILEFEYSFGFCSPLLLPGTLVLLS